MGLRNTKKPLERLRKGCWEGRVGVGEQKR